MNQYEVKQAERKKDRKMSSRKSRLFLFNFLSRPREPRLDYSLTGSLFLSHTHTHVHIHVYARPHDPHRLRVRLLSWNSLPVLFVRQITLTKFQSYENFIKFLLNSFAVLRTFRFCFIVNPRWIWNKNETHARTISWYN